MKYLVIEVIERDIVDIVEVKDLSAGIGLANKKLKKHMKNIGYDEEYATGEDYEDEWMKADASTLNAWCNYDENWDCHICELKISEEKE